MKSRFLFLLSVTALILGCPDRNRDNEYDPGNGSFNSPPPCRADAYEGIYDPVSGKLIGVVVAVNFIENLSRNFPITHIFYEDVTERMRVGYGIETGTKTYTITIYYGGPFPLGDYSLCLYWGEIGIAVCMFSVIPNGNRTSLVTGILPGAVIDVPEDCRFEFKLD